MDTMYRNKSRAAGKTASEEKKQKKHVSDGFRAKVRPRETYADAEDSKKRISKNLNKLNRSLVEHPGAKGNGEVAVAEDKGVRYGDKVSAVRTPIPVAMIFYLIVFLIVFLYFLVLDVQVEE